MGYRNIRELGKGSFGKVFLVKDDANELYAKKSIKVPISRKDKEYVIRELVCMRYHTCNHLIQLIDANHEYNMIHMITEYASRGDLRKLITSRVKISYPYVCKWILEVTNALHYLHSSNIIHRDVKSENIFLFSNKSVKLGDLGTLRLGEDNNATYIGTPYYMTPEIEHGLCSPKTDIYALGIVMYELIHGKPPFNGKNMKQLVFNKKTQILKYNCASDLQNVMTQMLTTRHMYRPDALSLLKNKDLAKYYVHRPVFSETLNLNLYNYLFKMTWKGVIQQLFRKQKDVFPKLCRVPKPQKLPEHLPLLKQEHDKIFKSNFILG